MLSETVPHAGSPTGPPRRPLPATGLLDAPPEEAFDRLTRLAARVLRVPAALISLQDGGRVVHKSAVGVPDALLAPRGHPAAGSLCALVAGTTRPLVLSDAREHAAADAVLELGMAAVAGVPLAFGDGPPFGVFCVMDSRPRAWELEEVTTLVELAAAAAREVEWRCREAGMRETEHDLRLQRVQLDELFETAPEAIVLLDVEERVVRANGEFLRAFGYRAEEVAGRPINELIVPPELREEAERVTRAVTSGRSVSLETVRRRRDGSLLDVWILGKPVRLDDSPVAIYLVYRDVTEHRRAERELRASEQRFRQLAENLRDVFYLNSADRREVLYVSPAYEQVWGRSREELYRAPRSWMLSVHPEDADRVRAVVDVPCAEYEVEYRIVRPDGEVRWIRERAIPIRDEDGRVYRDAGIAEDVTERKAVEEALRESEARYRQMFEGNHAIKLILDPDGGAIVEANPAAEAFYGYPAGRLRQMRVTELNGLPPQEVRAMLRQALVEMRSPFVVLHRLASGELRWMEVHTSPVEVQGRTLLFSILNDITDRRRAEQERADAVAARNRFYAMVSHELRTPISAVMLYNDLLLSGAYGALGEEQAEGVQRSQASAAGLLELVNEVLDLSSLEAGKLEARTVEFAPAALLRDVLATVRPLADEHGCELSLDAAGAPPVLATDPRRVRQVLLNLLSNAVKYGRSGPVRLACRRRAGGEVALEVSDRGPGIAPEDRERIFEEFVRLGDGSQPGTGLGLTIARRLAELIGGRLELDSVLGEGSTFRLVLPDRPA
ncbi:MAG TPA: PAS domain S-box protein [Longimicrobiaceae bacterium]|nr:PAS domain S-box protein [Longimicrobiaceae bacterium]